MFSTAILEDVISLKSKQIGSNIRERVVQSLKTSYEKKVIGKINGYIISIIDVNEDTIKDGVVNDINGDVNYKLEYTAAVFIPIKNNILDVTVDYCNDLGIWGHASLLPEVSIIECICPRHMIPKEYSHDEINDSWTNNDEIIQEGSEIKIKVENTQIDAIKILIIGSIVTNDASKLSSPMLSKSH